MQFVANGPDIPDTLLQAHEEGRVVFFCGAGISYPAGLPDFKGLVEKIYQRLGTPREEIEQKAYERGQFDATLDLLERRVPGQRIAVRKALAEVLQPKRRRKGAIDTHAALLQLARSREGNLRLITTNFDRIFEYAAKRNKRPHTAYAAPMLPIPKNSRWNGLVYLHGLLPDKPDDSVLHRLVISSGDFGLAYLTERWAARFVSELFRNFMVCFVGYSINDPVLRYMMDALAADRMLGEVTPQAYALGSFGPGQEKDKTIDWEAKGVTPILYEVPTGSRNHSALHQTLKAWAETYRDGTLGKERIVASHALARPSASTQQDDFVGRMLWALSDKSGLPAKQFADFNPAPSLDWLLEAFSDERYQHGDLSRFEVPPHAEVDAGLRFSLIRRPTPYNRAPRMMLVSGGATDSQWDDVMFHLARWLLRHLNDPELIIWLAQRGGQLNDRWPWLIDHRLDELARLESEGKTAELDEIRINAPNAIPSPLMQVLWRLLLTGRVKSNWREPDLYRWKDRLRRDGLTATLRLELRELLSPKVALKKPFHWHEDEMSADDVTRIKQLVDWELVLTADHVRSSLRDLSGDHWRMALPALQDDVQQLLRDALDLLRELGEADDLSDRSYWDLPSISPHWQNRGFRDWATLIELLRDSWLAVRSVDPGRATRIAQGWIELPYATFKRLALYAASQENGIVPEQWVDWLLADNARWLWSLDTMREVMRLLVLQGHRLTTSQNRLENAILAGPPRDIYPGDIEPEDWQSHVERSVWLRLAKLSLSGLRLGDAACDRMANLSAAHPNWQVADNERDEFSHWMSGTGDPDYERERDVDIAPHKRHELVQWLRKPRVERRPFYEDTWREVCRKHLLNSLYALGDLAREDIWPAERWREALQAWSEKNRISRSWRYGALLVQSMPGSLLQEIAHAVTWWLDAVSKSIQIHEDIFLDLCDRILNLPLEAGSGITQNGEPIQRPVTEAINHPVGHVTQALLNLWFAREPNDKDLLPAEIEHFFTQLCDTRVDRFRHGRVLLASRLIALFRVDQPWTDQHMLPLFQWAVNPVEAKAVWEGFLWSPRLYRSLLIAFKPQFLETARHYGELGEHSRQFAAFLTYAALEPIDGYTVQEFQSAFGALPQEGLQEAARALSQALEGAIEKREDYWRNRIQPFWQYVWPKSRDLASQSIAASLARMSIAADELFPSVLDAIYDWLQPIEHSDYVVDQLYKSGLCQRFPRDALKLLDGIIQDQLWGPRELGQCLDVIVGTAPELAQDPRYQRLREYSRRRVV